MRQTERTILLKSARSDAPALTPEDPAPVALKTGLQAGRLRFTMFLVYGIARVRTEPVRK